MVCLFVVCRLSGAALGGANAMSELVTTFADLRWDALLVDTVDQGTFVRVRDGAELQAAYLGLMTWSVIDGQPRPQTTWRSPNNSFDDGAGRP